MRSSVSAMARSCLQCGQASWSFELPLLSGFGWRAFPQLPLSDECAGAVMPGRQSGLMACTCLSQECAGFIDALHTCCRRAVRTSDESLKWLDWPDYLQVRQCILSPCRCIQQPGRLV